MGVEQERKRALRAAALAVRRQLRPAERARASVELSRRLEALPELRPVRTALLYAPAPEEPDLTPLTAALRGRGVTTLLPRVRGEHLELVATTSSHQLVSGFRGILEPPGRAEDPRIVDAAFVPGVAFDLHGGRLGQGGGHYDRLLAELDESVVRIGVAFACQIVPAVIREPHDEPVDLVVTERAAHRTGARSDPMSGA